MYHNFPFSVYNDKKIQIMFSSQCYCIQKAGACLNTSSTLLPKHISASRLAKLHIRLRIFQQLVERELLGEPVGLLFLRHDDRHPVMDEADAVGCFAGEDGEARQGSGLGLCVEPAEIEELLAPGPDGVFHLAVRAALPLEVAARRDEAAAQLRALAEKRFLRRSLAPRVYDEAAALSLNVLSG